MLLETSFDMDQLSVSTGTMLLIFWTELGLVGSMVSGETKYVTDGILKICEEAVNNCTQVGGVLPTARDKSEVKELRKWVSRIKRPSD